MRCSSSDQTKQPCRPFLMMQAPAPMREEQRRGLGQVVEFR